MAVFEIGFSGNPLDRLSQIRGDAAAVAELAADPAARLDDRARGPAEPE